MRQNKLSLPHIAFFFFLTAFYHSNNEITKTEIGADKWGCCYDEPDPVVLRLLVLFCDWDVEEFDALGYKDAYWAVLVGSSEDTDIEKNVNSGRLEY